MVKFQWCKLFQDTFTEKARLNPELNKMFKPGSERKSARS